MEILRIRESRWIIRLVGQSGPCRSNAHWRNPRHPEGHVLSLVRMSIKAAGQRPLDDRSPRPDRVWNRIPDDGSASGSCRLALDVARLVAARVGRALQPTRKSISCQRLPLYRLLKALTI